jgi:uncharacterized protein YbjT (DUF2867 family)
MPLVGARTEYEDANIVRLKSVTGKAMKQRDRDADVDVVTGAFGYTGRYITERLLESGRSVKTLTGHPNRPSPFGDRVGVAPFDFDDRRRLAEHVRGATTLYNTYWVRFPHGDVTFERAVANSETLIGAARDAGVRRIVHVSITNPSEDSPFAYFRGKARVEEIIRDSGLGYTIVRPTVIFGREDILINNIACGDRRLARSGGDTRPQSRSDRHGPASPDDGVDADSRDLAGYSQDRRSTSHVLKAMFGPRDLPVTCTFAFVVPTGFEPVSPP